jgi:hypothetical protein
MFPGESVRVCVQGCLQVPATELASAKGQLYRCVSSQMPATTTTPYATD